MGHRRHFCNGGRHESDKQRHDNKILRDARMGKVATLEQPMPFIDIGVDRITELIKAETRFNEDAFQEAWVKILDEHPSTEAEITQIAKLCRHKLSNQEIASKYKEKSLDKPLGDDPEGDFTLKDVLPSPEIVSDDELIEEQELEDTNYRVCGKYNRLGTYHLDPDMRVRLRELFPKMPIKEAIRKLLNMNPKGELCAWQLWEDRIMEKYYPWGGTTACAVYLNRSDDAMMHRAQFLGLDKKGFKPLDDLVSVPELARIFNKTNEVIHQWEEQGVFKLVKIQDKKRHLSFLHKADVIKFIQSEKCLWFKKSDLATEYTSSYPDWALCCHHAGTTTLLDYQKIRRLIQNNIVQGIKGRHGDLYVCPMMLRLYNHSPEYFKGETSELVKASNHVKYLRSEVNKLLKQEAEVDARIAAKLEAQGKKLAEREAEVDARIAAKLEAQGKKLAEREAEVDARIAARESLLTESRDKFELYRKESYEHLNTALSKVRAEYQTKIDMLTNQMVAADVGVELYNHGESLHYVKTTEVNANGDIDVYTLCKPNYSRWVKHTYPDFVYNNPIIKGKAATCKVCLAIKEGKGVVKKKECNHD